MIIEKFPKIFEEQLFSKVGPRPELLLHSKGLIQENNLVLTSIGSQIWAKGFWGAPRTS